ncbi:tetratricopeptide repeat protein [Bacteroidota bacterium]
MRKFIILISGVLIFATNLLAEKQGQDLVDSLLIKLPVAREDTNKVILLNRLSGLLYRINPDSGIEYALQGVELAKKLDWNKGIANSYNTLATNYWVKGNYDKSLEYYHKSLNINEEEENKKGIAQNLNNIGIIYHNQNKFDKALEYFKKSLNINREIADKRGIAMNLNNISDIYQTKENFDEALRFNLDALEIYEELSHKSGIAMNMGNIGNIYRSKGEYQKALDYYIQTLKISEELGDKRQIAHTLIDLSTLYYKLGEMDDSVKDKNPVLNIQSEILYKKAVEYGLAAASIAEKSKLGENLFHIYENIYLAYRKLGEYKSALEYYEKYQTEKESVLSEESQEKIAQLEMEYLLEKERREKAYRNTVQYSGISVLVILLFTGLFLIPRFNFSTGVTEAMTFITFLLFYEFILVFTEPWVDNFTEQVPMYKLGINIAIALLFIPFHKIEKRLRIRFTS